MDWVGYLILCSIIGHDVPADPTPLYCPTTSF